MPTDDAHDQNLLDAAARMRAIKDGEEESGARASGGLISSGAIKRFMDSPVPLGYKPEPEAGATIDTIIAIESRGSAMQPSLHAPYVGRIEQLTPAPKHGYEESFRSSPAYCRGPVPLHDRLGPLADMHETTDAEHAERNRTLEQLAAQRGQRFARLAVLVRKLVAKYEDGEVIDQDGAIDPGFSLLLDELREAAGGAPRTKRPPRDVRLTLHDERRNLTQSGGTVLDLAHEYQGSVPSWREDAGERQGKCIPAVVPASAYDMSPHGNHVRTEHEVRCLLGSGECSTLVGDDCKEPGCGYARDPHEDDMPLKVHTDVVARRDDQGGDWNDGRVGDSRPPVSLPVRP